MNAAVYPAPDRGLLFDGEDPTAPIRLLIVADGMGPTQHISFLYPLRTWRQAGAAAVRLIPEGLLARTRKDYGGRGLIRKLEEEFADFRPTVLIFSRYSGKDAETILRLAREARVPVVHHLDDDLFEVPIALGIDIYQRYRHPNRVYTTYRIAEAADLIYVSTPTLAERVRERIGPKRIFTARIYVGAEPAPPRTAPPRQDDEIRIGYMASAGHAFDFEIVAPSLFSIIRRFPKVKLHLFGTITSTAAAREFGDLAVLHTKTIRSYGAFRETMNGLDWDIGLAPLRGHDFNACKAPTKWVEYAEAGIATVASDHPVYRPIGLKDAAVLARDGDWETALTGLIEHPERRAALVQASNELMTRDYGWRRVEDQVLDLIAAVCQTDQPVGRRDFEWA